MKIVLVRGDEYRMAGIDSPIHLGVPTEVPEDIGLGLLASHDGTNGPRFVRQEDFDSKPLRLRLTDDNLRLRTAQFCAQGQIPLEVPKGVAPYLLAKRRPDGEPLFAIII